MSQLIIVDVQDRFLNHINSKKGSQLCSNILLKAKKYSSIVFIMDGHDGDHIDFPEELIEYSDEDQDALIFDPYSHPRIFKEYGFFRNLMDKNIAKDDIVSFGKFLLKHNVLDARSIIEDEDLVKMFLCEFKNSEISQLDFDSDTFYIPMDTVLDIQSFVIHNCIICGGGLNECLKEISILLDIIDIPHTIDLELTY